MPARNRKGRFVKRARARRSSSGAITKYRTRTVTKYRSRSAPRRHRRRGRRGSGGGIRPLHLALASAGVAYVTSAQGPAAVKNMVAKIPGSKTFGPAATLGVACLAIDKFVKPNKWLKLAGYAGIVAAAMKIGEQGTGFKWVGDEYDMAGDDDLEDVEDVDDLEDVEGDDDGY